MRCRFNYNMKKKFVQYQFQTAVRMLNAVKCKVRVFVLTNETSFWGFVIFWVLGNSYNWNLIWRNVFVGSNCSSGDVFNVFLSVSDDSILLSCLLCIFRTSTWKLKEVFAEINLSGVTKYKFLVWLSFMKLKCLPPSASPGNLPDVDALFIISDILLNLHDPVRSAMKCSLTQ